MVKRLSTICCIAIAVLVVGCTHRKVLQPNVADSISIMVNTREMVYLDSVSFRIPNQRETHIINSDSSYLSNDFAWSVAMLQNGQLYHALGTIPGTWYSTFYRKEITHDRVIYRNYRVVEYVKVPAEITAWQRWQMTNFWILLIYILFIRLIRWVTGRH